MCTGAGKWAYTFIKSIVVLVENKGGKTFEVKCLSGYDDKYSTIPRLKRDYLIQAITNILSVNKKSIQELEKYNALPEGRKMK